MSGKEGICSLYGWSRLPTRALPLVRFAIGVCVFAFFAGLDRAVFDVYLASRLGVDWLRQVYNVAVMLSFGLLGLTLVRGVIFPIGLNLCLLPFNTINPFVTRVGLAFWCGSTADTSSLTFIRRFAAYGTIVGTIAVLLDGLYVTFVHMTKTYGAGFFGVPNFVVCVVLGIPFLRETRFAKAWARLVVVASIVSGSDSVMLICLASVALTFHQDRLRIIMGGVLIAVVFALAVRTPLNYTYKTPHRVVVVYNLVDGVIRSLITEQGSIATQGGSARGSRKIARIDTTAIMAAREAVVQDRTFGFKAIEIQKWRLLTPLSHVRANDVGHIGVELYAATYGVILLIAYLTCAYIVLPRPIFVLLCLLLPLYTDPLFDFGVGLLALRAAPLCSAYGERTVATAHREIEPEAPRSHGQSVVTA